MENRLAFEAHGEADIGNPIASREEHPARRFDPLAPKPRRRRHMERDRA